MPNELRDEIERSRVKLINSYLGQLATAAGTEATKDRRALYCRALKDIGESPLKFAFEEALKHLGQFLPSIEQIRTWAEQWKPVDPIAETRRILIRDDKPTDWQALGRKSGATPEEIAEWLEEGKRAQLAEYAELAKDPKWREAQARYGVPEYRQLAERLTAERNGRSAVPADSDGRRSGARVKAVEMGWTAGREPGEELPE